MILKIFKILLPFVYIAVYSCGTIRTLSNSKNHVSIKAGSKPSFCTGIPYIYSGISYNFCMLYGEEGYKSHKDTSFMGFPLIFVDLPLCAVTDTLVLPYTIYKQISVGNIDVN